MIQTKHIVIQKDDIGDFQKGLDTVSGTLDVFATQTHVTFVKDKIYYTAVCFYKIDMSKITDVFKEKSIKKVKVDDIEL